MAEINLGKTLSDLRTARGVTQEEVATALSVSNKTVSKWENGDSFPDLSSLAELAKYYEVSTDYLLGLKSKMPSTADLIAEELGGMDRKKMSLKLFELLKATFPPCFRALANCPDAACEDEVILSETEKANRNALCLPEFFQFLVNSADVNFAVIQLRNQSNFRWLAEEEKQKQIGDFLSFLADPDVMKVLYFIHSTDCSDCFTAEYLARNTSVEMGKVVEILKRCCEIDLCRVRTGHLKTGVTEIYVSYGDGLILAILSIVYEKMCNNKSFNYYYGDNSKMIQGKNRKGRL